MGVAAETEHIAQNISQRSRQVWAAIIIGMIAFLFLCGASGLGIFNFVSSITDSKSVTIKALPPSALAVLRHNTTTPEQITGTTELQEGDVATTGKTDQALISLFSDSGSILVYPNTSLEMETLRASHFVQSSKEIAVLLKRGTIVMATAELGDYESATYTVSTDQAQIDVEPSAHIRVSVQDDHGVPVTQAVVDAGKATMWSHGKRIEIGPGQMAWVTGSGLPEGPAIAQVDLIRNGSFDEPPTSNSEEVSEGGLGTAAWLPIRGDTATDNSGASVAITDEVDLKAAVISELGGPNRYVKVGIVQDINQPASFFNSIEFSATVKLVKQEIPVGGPVPDVYPLVVRIVYTDQQGKNHEWKRSFYFNGPDPELTDNSIIKIAQGRWTTTHEIQEARKHALQDRENAGGSPDTTKAAESLFMLKSPTQGQDIAVINAIEVYGYGTQFQSWITGISLLAR
jgi:hypothetical protein